MFEAVFVEALAQADGENWNHENAWRSVEVALAQRGSPYRCRDRDPTCADWLSRGECANNPNYMMQSCRASCAALGADLPQRPHRPEESHTEARNPAVWACLLASAALFAACVGGTRAFARGVVILGAVIVSASALLFLAFAFLAFASLVIQFVIVRFVIVQFVIVRCRVVLRVAGRFVIGQVVQRGQREHLVEGLSGVAAHDVHGVPRGAPAGEHRAAHGIGVLAAGVLAREQDAPLRPAEVKLPASRPFVLVPASYAHRRRRRARTAVGAG